MRQPQPEWYYTNMKRRLTLDETYMLNALNWASRSKAIRQKNGAVIVLDKQTISDGYNGMPADSQDDCCELKNDHGEFVLSENGEMITNPMTIHAEANAILKLAAYGGRGAKGATLYCTTSPCIECTKLILQAKIARVVYNRVYRIDSGIEELRSRGVIVEQLELEVE
jgi:dCMP deaminase